MAARGRPRKPEGTTKEIQTTIRFSATLKEQLDASAKEHGISLSEEISRRLQASYFADEEKIAAFGGYTTYALCRLVAMTLTSLKTSTGYSWHQNRFTFEQALAAVDAILSVFRPAGSLKPPHDMPLMKQAKSKGPAALKKQIADFEGGSIGKAVAAFSAWNILLMAQREPPFDDGLGRLGLDLRAKLMKSAQAKTDSEMLLWLMRTMVPEDGNEIPE